MKEFESNFAEGIRTGLRKGKDNPINSQALTECHNLKPAEKGLVPFEPLSNPISGLTIDWPFPQLFVGSEVRLLALRSALYSVDSSWATSLELSFTAGSALDFADFGDFILATNGQTMIKRAGDTGVYSAFLSEDDIPGVATICNFKGQVVGGNVLTSWHGCGSNFVVWSDIGSASLTPTRRNEAGFMPMPWEGDVLRVLRLDDIVMVYGDNGIVGLIPAGSPAPTFGMREMQGIGIASKMAVGGDEHQHVFVDTKGHLWRIALTSDLTVSGPKVERLGYQEYMSLMTASDIVISYDPGEKEFFISDGVYGFLLNDYGLCQIHQLSTSVFTVNGSSYGVFGDSADNEARVVTDTVDYGLRGLKTVSVLELGAYSPQVIYAALDWRSSPSGAFTRSGWTQVNEVGVTTNMVTANEFRLCVKAAAYADMSLDYIKSRIKLVDKRSIRGVYSAA